MCSLFSRNSSNDFFCFRYIFSCNPTFSHIAFHVIFAVYMSRVDVSLLQSSFYSLLHLFSLCLFDSYFDFFLLHFFWNTVLINSNRVHSSNLHSYLLSQLLVNRLVESNNRAKAISVHVVVNSSACAFYSHVTIKFHFLTCDTATVSHCILYSTVTHRQCFYFVQCLAFVSHSKIKNILSQFHKVSILSYEVSFALQSNDNGIVTSSLSQNATFRSLTFRTLSSNSLSFLTDNLHCLVVIAISLC